MESIKIVEVQLRRSFIKTSNKFKKDQIVGPYKIIRQTEKRSKNKTIYWEVQCIDCNQHFEIMGTNIRESNICECKRKLDFGESASNKLYKQYQARSKRISISFDLSYDWFVNLTSKNCFYCNEIPKMKYYTNRGNGYYLYNSLDRVDNNKGYEIDNVVPCCDMCNRAKLDYTIDEFKQWLKRIYNHNKRWLNL